MFRLFFTDTYGTFHVMGKLWSPITFLKEVEAQIPHSSKVIIQACSQSYYKKNKYFSLINGNYKIINIYKLIEINHVDYYKCVNFIHFVC